MGLPPAPRGPRFPPFVPKPPVGAMAIAAAESPLGTMELSKFPLGGPMEKPADEKFEEGTDEKFDIAAVRGGACEQSPAKKNA